jgi:hypothetical protein
MPEYRLIPAPTGGPSYSGIYWDPYEWANRVKTKEAGTITKFRWYRMQPGPEFTPNAIRIRAANGALIKEWLNFTDNNAAGWQETVVSDGPALTDETAYFLILSYPSGRYVTTYTEAQKGNPDAGWEWLNNSSFGYMTGPGPGFFALSNAGLALDMTLSTEAPPGSPSGPPPANEPSPGTLNPSGSLPWWLHKDTLNPDPFWKLQNILINAIKDATRETLELAGALANYGATVAWGTPQERLEAIGAVLKAIWTDSGGQRPRMEIALADQIAGVETQVLTGLSGISSGGRAVADTVSVLDPGYTLTDTLVGAGDAVWTEPADKYVLTLTGWGTQRMWTTIGGIDIFGYRGSATALDGDLLGHYWPLMAKKHVIYDAGARMFGLLLNLPGDLEWTLEAYTYVPPAP